jgi:hypothetical protein
MRNSDIASMTTAAGLLIALGAGLAPAMGQDLEQRRACTPDVVRLCREFVPNQDLINKCLYEKKAELSPACLAVMFPPATPTVTPVTQTAAPKPPPAKKVVARVVKRRSHKSDCGDDD